LTQLTPAQTKRGMVVSVVEGSIWAFWFNLIANNFMTGYLLHLGASNQQIGLLAALGPLSTLFMLVGSYVLGFLSRRMPYLMGMVIGHRLLWTIGGFVPLFLPRSAWVWTYLGLYFSAGLCNAVAALAWQTIMADLVPADVRGRYFGMRSAWVQTFSILATLAGGWYLDRHPGQAGWTAVYAAAMAFAIINMISLLFYVEPPYMRRKPESPFRHLLLPFRSRSFSVVVIFAAALALVSSMVGPFYGVTMIKTLKLNYGLIAQLSAASTVAGITAAALLGRMLDRVGEHRIIGLLPLGSLIQPLLWLVIRPNSYILLFLVHILGGVVGTLQGITITNLTYRMSPRADRAVYLAVFFAVSGIGGTVAPILGGWVFTGLGLPALLGLTAAGFALLVGLWWAWGYRGVLPGMKVNEEESSDATAS